MRHRAQGAWPQAILDRLLEGVQVIGFDLEYLYVNEAAARHGRTTPDALIGRKLTEAYPGIEETAMFGVLRRCLSTGSAARMENAFDFPDGTRRWFELRFQPVPEGVLIFSLDVSAEQESRRALEEELALRKMLAGVAESVPGVICSFAARPDGSSCFPFTTRGVEDLYGVSQEALARDAAPVFANAHPADVDALKLGIEESRATRRPWHGLFRYRHPDRGERWIEGWSQPVPQPDGSTLWHGFVMDVTERREAEAQLRQTEQRLAAVFRAAPVGIEISRLSDGLILEVNDAWLRMFGFSTRYGVLGRRSSELGILVEPSSRDEAADRLRAIGRHETLGLFRRRSGGAVRKVMVTAERIAIDGEDCALSVLHDLTDLTRAHEALEEREALYRAVIETSADGFWITDREGRIVEVNHAYVRSSGYTREELLGRCSHELVAGASRAEVLRRTEEIVANGSAFFETVHRAKNGTLWPAEVDSMWWSHVGGGRAFWFIRDLKLRKRSELLLRTRLELADLSSRGDLALLIRRALDTVEQLTGSRAAFFCFVDGDAGELEPRLWSTRAVQERPDLTAGDRCPAPSCTVCAEALEARAWRAKNRLMIEGPGSRADRVADTPFERELVYPIIRDGRVVALLGAGDKPEAYGQADAELLRDVSALLMDGVDRLRAEQALALSERSQRETEAQLRQAQKMEAIGRLAGGIAHDFNNLLSVIISYAGFAIEAVREEDPLRADLEEVVRAGHRAASLTRQLLAFSRRQVLQPQILDLNRVFGDMESMLRRLIGEDIELRADLEPALWSARVDPGQIEQVIMNLVVNSRDAMPAGGHITVSTRNRELDGVAVDGLSISPGRFVALAVEDTGAGMTPEVMARMFEPFFTTKEAGKGTGLGLATVYGIVRQSGGDIRVTSEVGRGSRFELLLPREASMPAPRVQREALAASPATGEVVLVVEDEPAVRSVVRRVLAAAGFAVHTASSGVEALALIDGGLALDLLITDVVMPQMSGRELATRVVAQAKGALPGARLPVLFMSGYTDDSIAQHGVLEPGTRLLPKPFTAEALLAAVREALRRP